MSTAEENTKKITIKSAFVKSTVAFTHVRGESKILEHDLRDYFRASGQIRSEQHGVEIYAPGLEEVIKQADDLFSNARAEGFMGPLKTVLELVPNQLVPVVPVPAQAPKKSED